MRVSYSIIQQFCEWKHISEIHRCCLIFLILKVRSWVFVKWNSKKVPKVVIGKNVDNHEGCQTVWASSCLCSEKQDAQSKVDTWRQVFVLLHLFFSLFCELILKFNEFWMKTHESCLIVNNLEFILHRCYSGYIKLGFL